MSSKHIIVTGRSRAGTSIVAGIVHKSGIDMGKSRKSSINPKGYFQDIDFEEMFKRVGPEHEKMYQKHEQFEKEFQKLIDEREGEWGFKNGAELYFLPIIYRMLPNLKIIVCHRTIEDQIRSIQRTVNAKPLSELREGIHKYHKMLDEFFEKYDVPRLDVRFEKIFEETEKQIKRICDFLDKPFKKELTDFIDPDLWHYKTFYEGSNS